MTFDRERFIEECRAALAGTDAQAAILDVVARAVAEPSWVLSVLGEPTPGVEILYRARDLTILNLRCGPGMDIRPHDHRMWAVVGAYCGREENTFFRCDPPGLIPCGTKVLAAKETMALDAAVIHAVANPFDRMTAALHVYGGDLIGAARSEWDPDTFEERRYCVEDTLRALEAAGSRPPS